MTNIAPNVQVALDSALEALNAMLAEHTRTNFPNLAAQELPSISVAAGGRKYIKLVRNGTSAYAFIDAQTGDVYMPAGWSAPAKHVRGNIVTSGIKGFTPYGVVYLK